MFKRKITDGFSGPTVRMGEIKLHDGRLESFPIVGERHNIPGMKDAYTMATGRDDEKYFTMEVDDPSLVRVYEKPTWK